MDVFDSYSILFYGRGIGLTGGCMFNNLTSRATFYDITGYLMPGILSIGIGWATCYIYGGRVVLDETITALGKMGGVVTTLVLIAVGYVCGHFLNALSSAVYEKWLLKNYFIKAKDWQSRLPKYGKPRESMISIRAKAIYGVEVGDLQSFDLRIRAEEKLPQSFVTGFCFLSFYGMCRTLSLIALLSLPLVAKLGWGSCCCGCQFVWMCKALVAFGFAALIFGIAAAFAYQYLRFVTYYYDYLGSTLSFVAEGESEQCNKTTRQGAVHAE